MAPPSTRSRRPLALFGIVAAAVLSAWFIVFVVPSWMHHDDHHSAETTTAASSSSAAVTTVASAAAVAEVKGQLTAVPSTAAAAKAAGVASLIAEDDADTVAAFTTALTSLKDASEQLLNRLPGGRVAAADPMSLTNAGPNFQLQFHHMYQSGRDESLFVGVTCPSSTGCTATLESLFYNAARPRYIFVGLVEEAGDQVAKGSEFPLEATCVHSKSPICFSDQMRARRLKKGTVIGPAWARATLETMYRNERFVMFVQAPMVFSKDWDLALIKQWRAAAAAGAVEPHTVIITQGPLLEVSPVRNTSSESHTSVAVTEAFCGIDFVEGESLPTPVGVKAPSSPQVAPFRAVLVNPAFYFMERTALGVVPMDRHLLGSTFLGDAFLLSARYWTSGFNVFALSHTYTAAMQGAPKQPVERNATVQQAAAALFTAASVGGSFLRPLGTARPLSSFLLSLGGIDVAGRKAAKPNECVPLASSDTAGK